MEKWSKLYNKSLSSGLVSDEGPGASGVQGDRGRMTFISQ